MYKEDEGMGRRVEGRRQGSVMKYKEGRQVDREVRKVP